MGLFDKKDKIEAFNFATRQLEAKIEDGEKEETAKSKKLISEVVHIQLTRFQNSIRLWKIGIDNFEDTFYPTSEELIRVYNDAVLDSHLCAIIEARKMKTLSKDFKFVDENKEEDTETTEIFESEWFRDFLNIVLDTPYFGFTLAQFGDRIGKEFKSVDVVPREYVNPKDKVIRDIPSGNSGTSYDSGKYKPWVLEIGKAGEMGLLAKAAPLTIYKKAAFGSWADFTELFGNPMRIGRTDIRNEKLRKNLQVMLSNMSSTAWGVLDKEDEIEFVQTGSTDAFQTFDQQIERMNSEMSKLILGSTMTVDDGSSRSQSEVHEKTTGAFEKADSMFVEYVVNKCLIPFLNKYHGFNVESKFMFDNTETVTTAEQFERDLKLLQYYKVPAEYIAETYGTPVEEKEIPAQLQPGNPEEKDEKEEAEEKEDNDKAENIQTFADKVRALYEANN